MKRLLAMILSACLMFTILSVTALAVDNSRSYEFTLTANNCNEIQAVPGDIITVMLSLTRTNGSGPMYAMQDEINYDSNFFEFVEGSDMVYTGVETTDIELKGNVRAHYMNFLSLDGGADWQDEVTVGTFQLKVIADSGVSVITNEECKVSTYDGTDSYAVSVNNLRVIVSTECTVSFESNGGTEVPEQFVQYGETIDKPENPVREGYVFTGWFKDIGRTQPWDFDVDVVEGNMTLYAGWEKQVMEPTATGSDDATFPWWILVLVAAVLLLMIILFNGKKKVTFETDCRSRIAPIRVKRGSKIPRPVNPKRHSANFVGWTTEPNGTEFWDFDNDVVNENVTLYAKWL